MVKPSFLRFAPQLNQDCNKKCARAALGSRCAQCFEAETQPASKAALFLPKNDHLAAGIRLNDHTHRLPDFCPSAITVMAVATDFHRLPLRCMFIGLNPIFIRILAQLGCSVNSCAVKILPKAALYGKYAVEF